MDPVTVTHQTAESITNFGILVVLAAMCIVGAGVAIFFLVRLAYANYRKLEIKVDEQQREINELKNGARTSMLQQIRLNTRMIHEFCQVIQGCPGARKIDPNRILDEEITPS